MTMSINDVLTTLAVPTNSNKVVGMTLTIHSQKPNDQFMANYVHRVYYGFGYVGYIKDTQSVKPVGQRFVSDYIGTDPGAFRVLNNVSYSGDPVLRGQRDEYQTFIVKEPVPERWNVRIDPRSRFPRPVGSPVGNPPRITIEVPDRPQQRPWSVDLDEEDGFLRGIGADPTVPGEKASYCIVFGLLQDRPGNGSGEKPTEIN
jgi:hypothetical protein